jgi:phage-related protein
LVGYICRIIGAWGGIKGTQFYSLMVAFNVAPNVFSRIWHHIKDVFNDIDFDMIMKTSSNLPIGSQLRFQS